MLRDDRPAAVVVCGRNGNRIGAPDYLLGAAVGADDGAGAGLFEAAPEGDVVDGGVDIVPVGEAVDGGVVELVVEDGAAAVFDGVFYGGDGDDGD